MTLLPALACATLLATTPPAEPIPGAQAIADPWEGEPPCRPGPWRIECAACEPAVDVVGQATCVERDAMTEALGVLPGGFGAWRESNPQADLRVGEE